MGKKIPMWQVILVMVVLLGLLYWGIMIDTDAGEGHVALILAGGFAAIVAVGGFLWKAELRGGNLWFLHILPPVIMCALALMDAFKVFDKKEAK